MISFREDYGQILREVHQQGTKRMSRLGPVYEIPGYSLKLHSVTPTAFDTLAVGVNRGLSVHIAAVEAMLMIGGYAAPQHILRVAPQFESYMDGGNFWGNYGQRIRQQMPRVVQELRDDPDSRRAQVTIWDPAYDQIHGGRDYPCTTALQFYVRDGKLDMHAIMRSNDAYRGLPYDVFVFTQLQSFVAACLDLPNGTYFHYTSSLHLYEPDVEAALAVTGSPDERCDPVLLDSGCGYEPVKLFNDATALIRDSFGRDHEWPDFHTLPFNGAANGVPWYQRRYTK